MKIQKKKEFTLEVNEKLLEEAKINPEVYNRLYEEYKRYIYKVAYNFTKSIPKENRSVDWELDDFVSVANIAFVKAIDFYKDDKETKFLTLLSTIIQNEILMYIRSVKKHNNNTTNLEIPVALDNENKKLYLLDFIPDEKMNKKFSDIEGGNYLSEVVCEVLSRINKAHATIFLLSLMGVTERDISAIGGISQSYVSRIQKRIRFRIIVELYKSGSLNKNTYIKCINRIIGKGPKKPVMIQIEEDKNMRYPKELIKKVMECIANGEPIELIKDKTGMSTASIRYYYRRDKAKESSKESQFKLKDTGVQTSSQEKGKLSASAIEFDLSSLSGAVVLTGDVKKDSINRLVSIVNSILNGVSNTEQIKVEVSVKWGDFVKNDKIINL